ncbi:MAG: SEC-C metal-binding domain-containing protein, partial [Candidatus Sericytochromatia bacterium]
VDLPQQRAFGQAKRDTLPRYCRDCDVRFACHGGCPKDRFAISPDGERGLHYLCAGYQAFFRHVRRPMEVMAQLLREGRAPAELMATYSAEDARRGRNEPCTCGSGRKWKRCHGAPRVGAGPGRG